MEKRRRSEEQPAGQRPLPADQLLSSIQLIFAKQIEMKTWTIAVFALQLHQEGLGTRSAEDK